MAGNPTIPIMEPNLRPTGRCTGTVRTARFVVISADAPGGPFGTENPRIAEAGAGAAAWAVSCDDGVLNEEIALVRGSASMPMPCGAAVAAGAPVMSDSQGRPVPWTSPNHKLGVARSAGANAGDTIGVDLTL